MECACKFSDFYLILVSFNFGLNHLAYIPNVFEKWKNKIK